MLLSRESILAAPDLKTQTLEVPEWGGSVNIKELNGKQRLALTEQCTDVTEKNIVPIQAWLISQSVVDEQGPLLFTNNDIDKLCSKSLKALSKVFSAAIKLNGIGEEAVEDREKNLPTHPNDDSAFD